MKTIVLHSCAADHKAPQCFARPEKKLRDPNWPIVSSMIRSAMDMAEAWPTDMACDPDGERRLYIQLPTSVVDMFRDYYHDHVREHDGPLNELHAIGHDYLAINWAGVFIKFATATHYREIPFAYPPPPEEPKKVPQSEPSAPSCGPCTECPAEGFCESQIARAERACTCSEGPKLTNQLCIKCGGRIPDEPSEQRRDCDNCPVGDDVCDPILTDNRELRKRVEDLEHSLATERARVEALNDIHTKTSEALTRATEASLNILKERDKAIKDRDEWCKQYHMKTEDHAELMARCAELSTFRDDALNQRDRALSERRQADEARSSAESRVFEWTKVAQDIVDMFDPLKPAVSPSLLEATAKGAKQANADLRERAKQAELRIAELERDLAARTREMDALQAERMAVGPGMRREDARFQHGSGGNRMFCCVHRSPTPVWSHHCANGKNPAQR